MSATAASGLGRCYAFLYQALAGGHPRPRPWHFQWLVSHNLQRALDRVLPQLLGTVLDVGCGTKPYSKTLSSNPDIRVIGIDVERTREVDVLVAARGSWPFCDGAMDSVLCTETLEHVVDLHELVSELRRVMKPRGCLIVTVPFLYNVHGLPHDYRRFTREGLTAALADGFEITEVHGVGGVGSVTGVLLLNWIDDSCNLSFAGRILKGLLLPLWLLVALLVNCLALVLDKLDRTGMFYGHVLVVARAR